jgi:tRNA(Ile)-lysidine synthase
MQPTLTRRVLGSIRAQRMTTPGECVGVGVSGGADSVALLCLLTELATELALRLAVVHFNHQLRGAESDADEQFVAALAAARGLPFFVGRQDVGGIARQRGWNLEDAGRRLRYAFFESLVHAGQVQRVAVAHTMDDQAETVLARLVRGTGPAGLAAIYPVKGHVFRPLLGIRRRELRDYLRDLGQPWREDASNEDTTRLRARLRHDVLPILERDLQPAIVEHLGQLARLAREDESFWAALVSRRMGEIVRRESDRSGIRCSDLNRPISEAGAASPEEAHTALARRMVRGIVQELRRDEKELTSLHVQQVLRLATTQSSGRRIELPGIIVERSFDWLWFSVASPALFAGDSQQGAPSKKASDFLEFSHTVELGQIGETAVIVIPEIARRFRLKVIDWPMRERDTRFEQGALDRDLLGSPLVLRNWRPGDSFRPQGRRSPHKLKHFLRTKRVTVQDRAGWPVLTSEETLAWARGFPPAAEFAPRKATRTGVVIAEEEI